MKRVLSENTFNRIKQTIEMYRLNRSLLKEWQRHFLLICKDCIAAGGDKTNNNNNHNKFAWKCDCDVQFFLDLITELLSGNGGF